jgi:hypothetical protein
MLFLKGKSYKNEISDLYKNKKLFFYEYPSITDKDGKILYFDSSSVLKN